MVYGIFLRCIFCKKRNYIGKTDYLPPEEAWDEPKFSLIDVSEMKGRAGMPLVCCTNWVYPELRHVIIDEFEREHKQMIETLVHSGAVKRTVEELQEFFKRSGNEVGFVNTSVGEFIVPSSVIEAFVETMNRIEHGVKGPVPVVTRKTKLFSKMENTLLEQWRVVWNRCQCAFGGVMTDRNFALINKYGFEIEGSRVEKHLLVDVVKNSARGRAVTLTGRVRGRKDIPETKKEMMQAFSE